MLHLADLHIGTENYGQPNPKSGLHTRLEDYLHRLDEALAYVRDEQVDLVLIAGDIYKNRTPNPTHQREFARRINAVARAGIPVFILTGNHDAPAAATRAHSVEIFETLEIAGVTIASTFSTHTINTQGGPIQIVAVPWLNRQSLLTRDELLGLPLGAVEMEMIRRVGEFVESAVASLDPVIPTVLTFHGTVAGASYGSERSVMLGQDLVLPRSVIDMPGIDYIALGHIHKHQQVGTQPPAVYPGSLERIDFGEENQTKGFVIADIEKGNTSWRFVEVHARPFVTIVVDVREHPDADERIRRAIVRQNVEGAVVRVQVQCTQAQRRSINERAIAEQLKAHGAQVVAGVALEVERAVRGRFADIADELHDGLTPRRALELYLETKSVTPTRRERLLAAADELLKSEHERLKMDDER
jgi:exonuclease SbcD